MDEKYIQNLYNSLGGSSKFGKYDDFKSLISTNDDYRRQFHTQIGDRVLGDYNDFESLVKAQPAQPATQPTTQPAAQPSKTVIINKPLDQATGTLEDYQKPEPAQSAQQNAPDGTNQTITNTDFAPANQENPIDLVNKANELRSEEVPNTTTAMTGGLSMGTTTSQMVPDAEAVKQSEVIKAQLKKQGYDFDQMNKMFGDIPETWYQMPGFSKDDLVKGLQENPKGTERLIAATKWQNNLLNNINVADISDDTRATLKNTIINSAKDVNFDDKRLDNTSIIDMANKYVPDPDEKKKIISNLQEDRSFTYGQAAAEPTVLQNDPLKKFLNSDQIAAYHYIQDMMPEKEQSYTNALLSPDEIKDNPDAQLGREEQLKKLEEIGIQLKANYAAEKLAPIKNEYATYLQKEANGEQLTPQELQRAKQLETQGAPYQDLLTAADHEMHALPIKYPNAGYLDAETFAQELLGQKHNIFSHLALEAGKATGNTINGVVNFVKEPFLSDKSRQINQLEILGDKKMKDESTYLTQNNQAIQSFTPTVSKNLQSQIDEIKANDSLSDAEKRKQVTALLMQNPNEWQRTPIEGGKSNIGLVSVLYGVGDLAANLAPFMIAEGLTGGGATAGMARKFTSLFTTAAATTFQDTYDHAIEEGVKNPYQYAARVTAVNALAMAAADAPGAIRKLAGEQKTVFGDLVKNMDDKSILEALRKDPETFSALRKAYHVAEVVGKAVGESAKTAARVTGFTTGGQIANDAISGNLKPLPDYAKEALISAMNFTIFGALAGSPKMAKDLKEPNEMSKAALYISGQQPEPMIKAVDEKLKAGAISPDDAKQVKSNIENAAEIYKKVPFVDGKGNPLNEKDRRNLMFLKMQEADLENHISKDLPESLQNIMQDRLVKTQEKIDKVYHGTFTDDIASPEAVKNVASTENNIPETAIWEIGEDSAGNFHARKKGSHGGIIFPSREKAEAFIKRKGFKSEDIGHIDYTEQPNIKNESDSKEVGTISEALEKHENEDGYTFNDMVNNVEAIAQDHPESEKINEAINKYRKEQEYDAKVSGRGDMDKAETDLETALRSIAGKESGKQPIVNSQELEQLVSEKDTPDSGKVKSENTIDPEKLQVADLPVLRNKIEDRISAGAHNVEDILAEDSKEFGYSTVNDLPEGYRDLVKKIFADAKNIDPVKLSTSAENLAKRTISNTDAEKIIKDGPTMDDIEKYKSSFFDKYPFNSEDFTNTKNFLNAIKYDNPEPANAKQQNPGDAGNKEVGDKSQTLQGTKKPFDGETNEPVTTKQLAFKSKSKLETALKNGESKPISVDDISKFVSKAFDIPIRKDQVRWGNKLGIYKVTPEVIRVKNANDVGTIMHEMAHHIDKKFFDGKFPFPDELKYLDYDQTKKRPFEGFAEFIRKWMTGDETLEKESPKFLGYWENDFLENNPEVADKIKAVKQYVELWRHQGSLLRVLGSINKEKTSPVIQTEFSTKGKAATNLLDSNYVLKELVDKVLSLKGKTRSDYESDPAWIGKDPYMIAGVVAKTAGAKAKAWVLDGPTDFAGNIIGKSLKEIISPVSEDIDKALAYTISLRRLDRVKRGYDQYTKNDIEDAQYIVNLYKNDEKYNTFAKEVTEWNRLPIQYLVESGALSRDLALKIINSDAFYVPLRAFTEHSDIQKPGKVKGLSNTGKTVGRFKDKGGTILHPLEAMIQNVERMISVADKSRVVHALLNVTEGVNGIGKIIEEVPAPIQSMRTTIGDVKKQLEKSGLDLSETDLDSFLSIYSSGGRTTNLPENIIALFRNGKLKYYQVDPVLYKSIAGLDNSLTHFLSHTYIGRALVLSTKTLRLGATGARAGFQLISNPFRDFFTGIMQTEGRAIKVPIDNTRAVVDLIKGPHRSELLRRYKASGVEMATPLGADRRHIQGLVNKAIADPKQRKIMNIAMDPIEALKKVYDAYVETISFPESVPRVAEYKKVFEKYEPLIRGAEEAGDFKKVNDLQNARAVDAAHAANEVTLNFKKAGIYTGIINQFSFGFNPSIRGLVKMYSLLETHPARTLTRGIISMTVPAIVLNILHKDDDWFKNLPDWERYGFFHFKMGDHIIRLPRPFEWGWLFATLPESILDTYNDKDLVHLKAGIISGTTILPSVPLPDAIKPAVEAYFNWDLYKDRAITPKSELDLLPELQYGKYTSSTAKKLADILGVSPRKIDYLISGYTGGMGLEILNALPKDYKEPTDLPVVGRLFVRKSTYVENGKYTEEFYKLYARASQLKKSENKIKSGQKDNTLDLSVEDQYVLDHKRQIDKIVIALAQLRKKYSQVEKESIALALKEKTLDAIAYAQYLEVKNFIEQKKKDLDPE